MPIAHFAAKVLRLMGVVLGVSALIWLLLSCVLGIRLLNVQTASMRPTFRPGDGLLMQKIAPTKLQPGMIVSYHSPRNPNELVTHRVVLVTTAAFQTKGDALSGPDPVVRGSLLAGRVVAVIPGLGRLLGWLASWTGLVIVIYIPVGVLVVYEVMRLRQYYRRTTKYTLLQTTSGMMNRL